MHLSPRCLSCFTPQSPLQSKKVRTGANKLENVLRELLESRGETWTEELRGDLPRSFQRHGDLLLLGERCFSLPLWKKMGTTLVSKLSHTFLTWQRVYKDVH